MTNLKVQATIQTISTEPAERAQGQHITAQIHIQASQEKRLLSLFVSAEVTIQQLRLVRHFGEVKHFCVILWRGMEICVWTYM